LVGNNQKDWFLDGKMDERVRDQVHQFFIHFIHLKTNLLDSYATKLLGGPKLSTALQFSCIQDLVKHQLTVRNYIPPSDFHAFKTTTLHLKWNEIRYGPYFSRNA
jgi:hypothetical protein